MSVVALSMLYCFTVSCVCRFSQQQAAAGDRQIHEDDDRGRLLQAGQGVQRQVYRPVLHDKVRREPLRRRGCHHIQCAHLLPLTLSRVRTSTFCMLTGPSQAGGDTHESVAGGQRPFASELWGCMASRSVVVCENLRAFGGDWCTLTTTPKVGLCALCITSVYCRPCATPCGRVPSPLEKWAPSFHLSRAPGSHQGIHYSTPCISNNISR